MAISSEEGIPSCHHHFLQQMENKRSSPVKSSQDVVSPDVSPCCLTPVILVWREFKKVDVANSVKGVQILGTLA